MRVLLTGAGGQVGRALTQTAPADVELIATTREQLDIGDAAAVRAFVRARAPAVIVNAAAYTAVDRAEDEQELAEALNGRAPGPLAQAAQALAGCRLVHLSTDYVFDGHCQRPYRPDDAPHPLNAYGRTKLQGERAVTSALGARAIILRTAWVYAPEGRNFLLTVLRLMRERGEVRVVADQHGAPTSSLSVAAAIWAVVKRPEIQGTLHWTDAGVTSWYEFACAIAEEAMSLGLLASRPRVQPITTAEFPTAATRPASSVLDLQASAAALGLAPTPWREALRAVMRTLGTGA